MLRVYYCARSERGTIAAAYAMARVVCREAILNADILRYAAMPLRGAVARICAKSVIFFFFFFFFIIIII